MFKIKYLAAYLLVLSAPLTLADELSETGEFLDGIAAIVDDGVVLKSQLEEQIVMIKDRAAAQNIPLPPEPELREQLLERLILQEIQLQWADRFGVQISDQILNNAIGSIAQNAGVTFEQMPALLEADGIDYAKFRRDLRTELIVEQLTRIQMSQIIVTQREIDQCLADLEDNVAVNSDYNISNILVEIPENATSAQIEEALAEIESIKARLDDGADFAALAIRFSAAPTALDGGALGWLEGGLVPSLYLDVVANMEPGEVSEPIRAPNSFHLVKVNDLRSANERSEVDQVLVRHILIMPDEIIDDQTAEQQLIDAREKIVAGEDFGEQAKLLSDDPGSSNTGGEMDWAGSGIFVPEFEEVVDSLEIGELSDPFRSRFGWHIVEVLDRRVYDNTEDLKAANCENKLRADKVGAETQLWHQRIRDEAYVDKRI